jgi:hypothetical protein
MNFSLNPPAAKPIPEVKPMEIDCQSSKSTAITATPKVTKEDRTSTLRRLRLRIINDPDDLRNVIQIK